jgi:hypothetical protein
MGFSNNHVFAGAFIFRLAFWIWWKIWRINERTNERIGENGGMIK